MESCVGIRLEHTRNGIRLEGRQRLQMAIVAVARCAQRYKLLFVVAAITQGSRVVQLQSVVRVPGIAAPCASVIMLSEDGLRQRAVTWRLLFSLEP